MAIRLPKSRRPFARRRKKILSSFYTKEWVADGVAALVRAAVGSDVGVAMDPFCGSGVLIRFLFERGLRPREVVCVDVDPEAVAAAERTLSEASRGKCSVRVLGGDAFRVWRELPRADLIVTNPPFTRWELVKEETKKAVLEFIEGEGYGRFVGRMQMGLHLAGLCLAERLLAKVGVLAAVLPASTFYSNYGSGALDMLAERFNSTAVFEGRAETSLSRGSGFKEVLLVATRGLGFSGLQHGYLEDRPEIRRVGRPWSEARLEREIFHSDLGVLREGPLKDALSGVLRIGLRAGRLRAGRAAFSRLIRGVEMYGPDFFLVPNRWWRMAGGDGGEVTLEDRDGRSLSLPRSFLIPCLRRPQLYARELFPGRLHYLVAIPPIPVGDLPEGAADYVRWGESTGAASAAMRAFGGFWYSHVHRQVSTKRPLARLFLPDKVDPTSRGVYANLTPEPVSATKNFYLAEAGVSGEEPLAAWFNSTFFLGYLLLTGRQVGRRWTRFLRSDFASMLIPSPEAVAVLRSEALNLARVVGDRRLPTFREQMGGELRREIDLLAAKMIGLDGEAAKRAVEEIQGLVGEELDRMMGGLD